jgi:hypothetical protein
MSVDAVTANFAAELRSEGISWFSADMMAVLVSHEYHGVWGLQM